MPKYSFLSYMLVIFFSLFLISSIQSTKSNIFICPLFMNKKCCCRCCIISFIIINLRITFGLSKSFNNYIFFNKYWDSLSMLSLSSLSLSFSFLLIEPYVNIFVIQNIMIDLRCSIIGSTKDWTCVILRTFNTFFIVLLFLNIFSMFESIISVLFI
jgi:hypothetical protein